MSTIFELLDLPTVIDEYLDTFDDGRPERALAGELQRRCAHPYLFLYVDRAVLVTPLGVRAYPRRASEQGDLPASVR